MMVIPVQVFVLIIYYSIYGRSCLTYKKRILCYCKSQKELDLKEAYYINKHLGKEKCLNIIEGGLHNIKNNEKQDFHLVETEENGIIRSADLISDSILYYKIDDIPLYKSKCGKLYSKSTDLQKHGINFYV